MVFLARLMMVLCFFAAPAFGWIVLRGVLAIRDDYGIGVLRLRRSSPDAYLVRACVADR